MLHRVHGTFQLKEGALRLSAASGKLTGKITGDASGGENGGGMRDQKCIRRFRFKGRPLPGQIVFRADGVDGEVAPQGKSEVRVPGIFTIHGADHELTVPSEAQMARGMGRQPSTSRSLTQPGG